MRLVKQRTTLRIQDIDTFVGHGLACKGKDGKRKRHGPLLPDNIRCIISGPSNAGKTNLVFNLLFDSNAVRFENVYVFSKSLYQPKYKFLAKVLPREIGYFAFDDNSKVIHPSDARSNSVMIFDDIACEKHDNIRNYFTMGRHKNIDTFYLGQTYSRIPKQLVRDNTNLLVLFKQDDMNLKHIYNDHVNTDMVYSKFREMCSKAWVNKFGFLVIDKDSDIENGRYRIGFDSFVRDF